MGNHNGVFRSEDGPTYLEPSGPAPPGAKPSLTIGTGPCSEDRARMMRRKRDREQHRLFLVPAYPALTSIPDLILSWSRGEWLIIDGHSYHPDFYINWRLRKLVGAVMGGKVYKAMGPDGEVYRVEGWETEHKEGGV